MNILTVNGEISDSALGKTLPHEHIFIDQRKDARLLAGPPLDMKPENFASLRLDPTLSLENMEMSNTEVAIKELFFFRDAGGQSIVDVSVDGLGRNVRTLAQISKETNINIICGTGWYVNPFHPPYVSRMGTDELAQLMIRDISEGIDSSGIRAGVIGELGCRQPLHPDEKKVLQAAAIAQSVTGAGLTVHPALFDLETGEFPKKAGLYLDILSAKGANLSKIWVSHMDFTLRDIQYHEDIMEKYGVTIAYDTFGHEYIDPSMPNQLGISDFERLAAITDLVSAGFEKQLLISSDVCFKCLLRTYGGHGYAYVFDWVVPLLRQQGVSERAISQIVEDNPTRLLSLPARV